MSKNLNCKSYEINHQCETLSQNQRQVKYRSNSVTSKSSVGSLSVLSVITSSAYNKNAKKLQGTLIKLKCCNCLIWQNLLKFLTLGKLDENRV